jgi:preprotein translocase subunit SecY
MVWLLLGALVVCSVCSALFRFPALIQVVPLIYIKTKGGVLDIFNTFSGGSLERIYIALGVMPYITASIVVQVAALSPTLAAIKKDGEAGRKKFNQYTLWYGVGLTAGPFYRRWTGKPLRRNRLAGRGQRPALVPYWGSYIALWRLISRCGWVEITSRGIGNSILSLWPVLLRKCRNLLAPTGRQSYWFYRRLDHCRSDCHGYWAGTVYQLYGASPACAH